MTVQKLILKDFEGGTVSTIKENVHVRINILGSPLESPGLSSLFSKFSNFGKYSIDAFGNITWVNFKLCVFVLLLAYCFKSLISPSKR